ncbi:hypothetical protein Taro_013798 [Colocasia esculenta]|uniref:MULE transposase domain-containing protein n=1 Tax=Colocasia esculenta TaxID=4460 RepID=A0A843UCN6_COLES|nr:hypothetical protein [Colocasia esculenta]
MLFTDPISFVVHETFVFLCDPMEQLPGRCSFGDQSFVLYIGRDTDLASIHSRVSQRLGVNMQENILKYRLPMDTDVEQMLLDDGDVQAMFDLHKCQGTSFINLQIHAVETRCLSTHASRQSEVLQIRMAVLWKPPNPSNYQEAVWSCTTEDKERKNDSVRLTVCCNVSICPWRLHASVVRGGQQFAIKSLNNIHTCGCDIMSDGHPQTSKKWVANAVKGKLVDKPTYRASEMMSDIRREYGICIPYHQGKEAVVSSLYGDFRTSYNMLNWYNERALQSNPGSILSLEVDPETQRFKRFFICFEVSAYGFEIGFRPMLFLDGTHIKQHRVEGVILAASALNGNNELFTVAYSIADSETYDNWVWFLQNLKKALLSDRRIAFLLDRGRGLKEAIPDIFPNDHHGYYFQHIMQNFNDQCAGKYAAPFKKLLEKFSSALPMLLLNKGTKMQ